MTREMISKSVEELTKKTKSIYGDRLKEVILFGSCARGDYTDESDIDVMILLAILWKKLVKKEK